MKITFKTPDVLDYALEYIPKEEQEVIREKLTKWIQFGEYIDIEFDLEKGTATVLEQYYRKR